MLFQNGGRFLALKIEKIRLEPRKLDDSVVFSSKLEQCRCKL